MMLRYIYFLSLLLFIPLSEEEYLSSYKRFHRSNNRNGQFKQKTNKLESIETVEDKEPMAYIDVASFIQSPDDVSIDSNQPFVELSENRRQSVRDYANNSLLNSDDEVSDNEQSQDYQRLESNNIPEVNIYNHQFIPRYVNRNSKPSDGSINNNVLKNCDDESFNNNHGHNTNFQKKCILKGMKIPFFFRNKSSTTKMEKNKKRKLFALHKSKKNSNLTKVVASNLNSDNGRRKSGEQQQKIKVNKRSYFQRLCPDCKKKVIHNSNIDWIDKCCQTANNVIHNSRQYYQNKIQIDGNNENILRPSNFGMKPNKHLEKIVPNYSIDIWNKKNEALSKKDKIVDDESNTN